MERTAHYGFFAERYGWTQDQVDAQADWYTARLPAFAQLVDEVNTEKRNPAAP